MNRLLARMMRHSHVRTTSTCNVLMAHYFLHRHVPEFVPSHRKLHLSILHASRTWAALCKSAWTSNCPPPTLRDHKFSHYLQTQHPVPLNENFNNDPARGPLKLPGYGHPIDELYYNPVPNELSQHWDPMREGFAHGFSSWIQPHRNLVRELHMIRVMDALTDKPQWDVKIFNETILAKWKAEAMNFPGRLISEMAWTWIVKELRWKAVNYWCAGYLTTLETCSTIVKGDELIGDSITRQLREAVKPLIETNEQETDWHPGSDQKVLNLVHPSLYSLVYGRTRILSDRALCISDYLRGMPDEGIVTDVPQTPVLEGHDENENFRHDYRFPYPELWSTKFQWLPCDVEFIKPSGDEVRIVSYINNLHPAKYRDLYHVIEKIISKSIQPWNEVLSWNDPNESVMRIYHVEEIKYKPNSPQDYDHLRQVLDDMDGLEPEDTEGQARLLKVLREFLAQPENPSHIPIPRTWWHPREPFDPSFAGVWWNNRNGLEDELSAKWERIRVTDHPEPGAEKSFEDWKRARQERLRPKIEDMFRQRGLQVIVKLASIELTPEKPEYGGGNWHLEGKMNEHIVATSIYYYDVENITESRIQFRQEAQLDSKWDVKYSADDHGPIEDAYGARGLHDCEAIQETGSIVTRQDRLLVFPNIVQHRVEPFRLKDPAKPGHRRFLVLWLVDPHYRVISTRNVAPQQEAWWKDERSQNTQGMAIDREGDSTGSVMRRTEAEEYRLDLMKERTAMMDGVESSYERYDFCEH